jgi:hypothetical protein
MEEARAHLSNSWDLEVWAAGTLQMHLSLGLELRQVLQINWISCQPAWSASNQALSHRLPARDNMTAAVDTGWEVGEQGCTAGCFYPTPVSQFTAARAASFGLNATAGVSSRSDQHRYLPPSASHAGKLA